MDDATTILVRKGQPCVIVYYVKPTGEERLAGSTFDDMAHLEAALAEPDLMLSRLKDAIKTDVERA